MSSFVAKGLLSTNNPLFINLNVAYVVQEMLVTRGGICINAQMTTRMRMSSSIGKHFCKKHSCMPKDLTKNFIISKKCRNKLDWLFYDMFLY